MIVKRFFSNLFFYFVFYLFCWFLVFVCFLLSVLYEILICINVLIFNTNKRPKTPYTMCVKLVCASICASL